MRTFKNYSLSNCHICNIVLLTIVTMLFITSPWLISFITGSLYLLTSFIHFAHLSPPAFGNHQSVLCIYELRKKINICWWRLKSQLSESKEQIACIQSNTFYVEECVCVCVCMSLCVIYLRVHSPTLFSASRLKPKEIAELDEWKGAGKMGNSSGQMQQYMQSPRDEKEDDTFKELKGVQYNRNSIQYA